MSRSCIAITCRCCNTDGKHESRGLIRACYKRHATAGTLDQYPPLGEQIPARWRREEYAELRAERIRPYRAAQILGVSLRTVARYEAHLQRETERNTS